MNYRDFLQQVIYKLVDPVVRGFIRLGITPNFITTTGFVLNLIAAAMLFWAAEQVTESTILVWVAVAGGTILFAGLFDMLDGRVARLSGKSSTFGALYDSVLDRYSELITYMGISYFLFTEGHSAWGLVSLLALNGSLMVSYVRARAEGLNIECKVGFMQRPERVVLTSLGVLLYGLMGHLLWLGIPLAVIAVAANQTALMRILHCYRVMEKR
ncbi:MAG: CDP-alcohol phosphatidyltransferase family protein [Bacteroides sp.]|nr:CDP-alcohol phosphatidyltransferase family protein [Bacteroides sp.]